MGIFESLTGWHWLGLAALMLILEMTAPFFFFLWLAMAAAVLGVFVLFVPTISWQWQLMIFCALSVLSILAWRRFRPGNPESTDQPALNKRGHQYIGRVFTLIDPIENGRGKIKVGDTLWRVAGADLPAGATIKVVGVDGVVFQVEAD